MASNQSERDARNGNERVALEHLARQIARQHPDWNYALIMSEARSLLAQGIRDLWWR